MITTVNLSYSVSGQTITPVQEIPYLLASNTVKYVKAQFALDENWASCDSVKAVWSGINSRIVTLLNPDGICYVPHELLAKQQKVYVNLTGSDFEEDTLIDRITTYPLYALNVNATAYTDGSETAPITPSQFEQFVEAVKDEVGKIKDIDSVELNADYTLTISFSDGTETTVGPIRGEQGETGNGIASAVLNDDYTLTLTFTDGTSYTTPSIRGEQGEQGEPGEVTLAQLSAVLPTDTASGAIASFPDGSDLFDYLSCVVNIEPVQAGSGTPSPDNVRPITGWTGCEVSKAGVNLLDESTLVLGYIDSSGVIVTSASYRASGYIRINPNDSYTLSLNRVDGSATSVYGMRIAWYDKDKTFIQRDGTSNEGTTAGIKQTTATAPANAKYARISTAYSANVITDRQFETGSTATTYKPYSATTYSITWQTEAGTVYGGTVDVVSGVLTVLYKIWTPNSSNTMGFDNTHDGFYVYPTDADMKSGKFGNGYSSMFERATSNWNVPCSIVFGYNNAVIYFVNINQSQGISTIQNVKDWLDEKKPQVLYELAQAQTYQLDPVQVACLLGQNNVWADCGDTSVTYKADVQRWVEKMLGQ